MRVLRRLPAIAFAGAIVMASPAGAQFAPPSVTTPPAPTYGYQPYNPSNPTGFNHPNDMGYGAYHNPTKLKGHRSSTMTYRHFHGY